jgi:hypothetical protein
MKSEKWTFLKLLKNYKADGSRKWVNSEGVNKFPNYTAG